MSLIEAQKRVNDGDTVRKIRRLLLGNEGFDDTLTADAETIAEIATMVGLTVHRDEAGDLLFVCSGRCHAPLADTPSE